MENTKELIFEICDNIKEFLLEKNKRYGDSALNPNKIFSSLSAEEGICQRIDDKLKRVENNEDLQKNDVVDLIGYLILLCIKKDWLNFREKQGKYIKDQNADNKE